MTTRNQIIRASRFVISTLKPMQRIAMDTIGPFPEVTTFKFIIVLIDTFTRYVELFPSQTVSATSAVNALWRHICRFCTPIEIMTDRGTQFMNQTLTHLTTISGIRHHLSIPYSKEENGIVERANKEVNRHIRNILADTECIHEWPQMLCMIEKVLNSSIKQPLGVSPNTILFGAAIPTEHTLLAEIDNPPPSNTPRSIRDYVDTLMARQGRIIEAAILSQKKENSLNLQRRYANYPRAPILKRRRSLHGATEVLVNTMRASTTTTPRTAATRWINDPDFVPFIGPRNFGQEEEEQKYIPLLTSGNGKPVDTIAEIDVDPYVPTRYTVNDYVLRRYPPTKIGDGHPEKYGTYWRGPYVVTKVTPMPMVYGPHDKVSYTIRNLTTGKEYLADVTHLRPFFYDPRFTTPLNVAARDTKEYVVKRILRHDFSDPENKRWLVQWALDGDEDETWEPFEVLKDVEAFHTYCAANGMSALFPKKHPAFAGLNVPKQGNTKRRHPPPNNAVRPTR